jgi:hypothetical protein
VVDGLVWPAIRCAISIVSPELMYSVTPVARKLWQHTRFRIPLAFACFSASFKTLDPSISLQSFRHSCRRNTAAMVALADFLIHNLGLNPQLVLVDCER